MGKRLAQIDRERDAEGLAAAMARPFHRERLRQIGTLLFVVLCSQVSAAGVEKIPRESQQCLVVVTDSWSSSTGTMFRYERRNNPLWHQRGPPIPVLVGRSGLAWGRGLLDTPSAPGPIKKEGDDKAPAGVFRLHFVFGYASERPAIKMPYRALSRNVVAVDDPASRYYNQLLDQSKVRKPDWRSAEKMVLADDRYKWGIFVDHNTPPKPGAGSCIFVHVWKDSTTATSGCTAMPEKEIVQIIHWLDPGRHPLIVQMPRPVYKQIRGEWNLPEL